MCAIILTEERGLIRVYPIPAANRFRVWASVVLQIKKSNTDTRLESFRLESWEIEDREMLADDKRQILDNCLLRTGTVDALQYQNNCRRSIAMVKLIHGEYGASMESKSPIADDHWIMTQQKSWNKPFILWKSKQGSDHRSHIVAREAYEYLRKWPHEPHALFRNMGLNNPDWEHWLLLGNMRDKRNVWVAVHVHRLKKTTGHSMLPSFNLMNGNSVGWPYLDQEDSNVAVANNQLLMFTTEDMSGGANHGNTKTTN
ncbi:MAG: hypothetical protein OEY16_01335 [Alphaproteobacteria bacterium]|nr:hypothetical protein [Alphaproteobacteria bacterium]